MTKRSSWYVAVALSFSSTLVCAMFGGTVYGDDGAKGEGLGWSMTKPADGPFVEVDGKFMVPYKVTMPGTEVSFEMIPVPGGVSQLGSPEGEEGRSEDEGPQYEVELQPYWVGKCEVTWAEYKQFMGMYNVFKKFQTQGMRKVTADRMADAVTAPTPLYEPSFTFEYGEDPQQPAITMTQFAAKQYTKWLSGITGDQYRLPSEAEWEHAARAGSKSAYAFGDDVAELEEYAWFSANADAGAKPVGTKKPNAWGLYDMHGNVAEWTVDQYSEEGYKALAGKKHDAASVIKWPTVAYPRTVRGGSWEFDADKVRSSSRLGSNDEDWKDEDPNIPLSPWWLTTDPARGVGFRLVRSMKSLSADEMKKFWEVDHEDIQLDVEIRLEEGRGAIGITDKTLPEDIQKLNGK
jgi:sulfatase modifying factor 1